MMNILIKISNFFKIFTRISTVISFLKDGVSYSKTFKNQSDISKMLQFSTSNLVSFMLIKSRHFTEAYLILLHKTSHTSCVLFFFWFPRAGSRESTPSVSSS